MPTLVITPINVEEAELWRLARDITRIYQDLPWVVIGGVMVRAIEAEYGVEPAFVTGDLDTVLDLQAHTTATQEAAKRLLEAGFEPLTRDRNIVYRFKRGNDVVDVLAPDHLGQRTPKVTIPPNSTIEADGSRQALTRRRELVIDAGDGPFRLPLPDLLGAILVKAQAIDSAMDSTQREKHERDLARLLILVSDPLAMRSVMTNGEVRHLRAHAAMLDATHTAWSRLPRGEDGVAALSLIITQPPLARRARGDALDETFGGAPDLQIPIRGEWDRDADPGRD